MLTFSKQTYIERREKLKQAMNDGLLLFLGNEQSPMNYDDNCYPFRQDSTFLYFFGIDQPGLAAIIDLDNDREIIFGNEHSMDDIVWTGPQPTIREQAEAVGVSQTKPKKELDLYIESATKSKKKVHYLPPYRAINRYRLADWLGVPVKRINESASIELVRAVIGLRSYKSDEELGEMAKAVDITRKLHIKANEMARSGVFESRIHGVLSEIAIAQRGMFAYPPIITINGQTLHNHHYHNELTAGRMLLVDAGAEADSHYAADITRTFPVDETFTDQQRDVYSIVLKAEKNAITNCRPGVSYAEVHNRAMMDIAGGLKELGLMKGDLEDAVNQGAHALFCPHGLGHMIGLDVHDMEDLGEDLVGYDDQFKRSTLFGTKALRFGRKLEPGFTLTVEPGLYFIPELIEQWKAEKKFEQFINYSKLDQYLDCGGARVEDNIVITSTGCEVIGKPIPKELEEIEEM